MKRREFRTNFKPCGSFASRRNELRKIVIDKFLTEEPGKGRREKASMYKYFVEKLKDSRCIYLTRPAPLKLGFDFLIHVEGETFKRGGDNPAHDDIRDDLMCKKKENPTKYRKLHEMMMRVYENCEEPDEILKDSELGFKSGLSIEIILKVLKWFFIQQDIRYWNYSGREMYKREILDKVLKDP